MQGRTRRKIEAARAVLATGYPMTLRQVFYQLVSGQVLKNTMGEYKSLSRALVEGRKAGMIPWDWIEDRLRRPREIAMWDDLADYRETIVGAYRRNVWAEQSQYIEAWLEKDALSGICEAVLRPYGVTLNVGRGYDSWTSIKDAAGRYGDGDGVTVLYFGDLDPSGEDMVRSLGERLAWFGAYPEIVKCALVPADIAQHNLPPALAKRSDSRRAAYVERFGDVSVELDALPVAVLRARLRDAVVARLDADGLAMVRTLERRDRERLARVTVD